MFSVDSTFSLRFLIILILSVFMIWDQTTKVLFQMAALNAPGLNDDWSLMGLNASGRRVTEIDVCRGAWTCGQTRCEFFQNPTVETVVFMPFTQPQGPCYYSLRWAFIDVWHYPVALIAMCFLVATSLWVGLWAVCLWWRPYLAWVLYCVSRVCLVGGIITVGCMLWSGDAHHWVWGLGVSVQTILGVVGLLELASTLQAMYVMRMHR